MKIFKNRTVLGIICVILSLGICFGVAPMMNKSASEKTEIVRVKSPIKNGDEITADLIETAEVGSFGLPENVIKDADTLVGSYALADFSVGDFILNDKISAEMQAENEYLYNLDGSKQAISVTIKSFAGGLSGKLESGDIVSVISADYKGSGVTEIPKELQFVEVISVTADSGNDANQGNSSGSDEEESKELPSTVTVLVTPLQSKILAELECDGEIHLSLVYRGDAENCSEFLEKQAEILAQFEENTDGITEENQATQSKENNAVSDETDNESEE